jgi:hypothetical protein
MVFRLARAELGHTSGMGRALVQWFGVAISAVMTISSVTQRNPVGAAFFGVGTLSLLWWAIRPEPDPDSPARPLRAFTLGAAGASAVAAILVLAAVGSGGDGRGDLAVVAAVSMGALASLLWCFVVIAWRRSHACGGTSRALSPTAASGRAEQAGRLKAAARPARTPTPRTDEMGRGLEPPTS